MTSAVRNRVRHPRHRSKKRRRTGKSACDEIVDLLRYQIESTDWENEYEIVFKSFTAAKALADALSFRKLIPKSVALIDERLATPPKSKPNIYLASTVKQLHTVSFQELRTATEFITRERDPTKIGAGWATFRETETALALLFLPLVQKPCCMLYAMAWMIPNIARGSPAIRLVSYAAGFLAELINEPTAPYRPHCTQIGNNWLHRLGIYLLHCCELQKIPPPMELTRLLSLASTSKAGNIKAPRTGRMHETLVTQPYPLYLHESPAAVATGYMLALELLGEIDANRQLEHFRRIERAVAYCALTRWYKDSHPSIKSVQDASGLSWADSKELMSRWFFTKLVFEFQCRHQGAQLHMESCPECKKLRDTMPKKTGKRLPSSVSN